MFAPIRTWRSPLQTTLHHSRRFTPVNPPVAFRNTLHPVRSFTSTAKVADVARQQFRRTWNLCRYTGYFLCSSAFGVVAIGAGIFVHDIYTYTDRHVDRVPCKPQELQAEKGGPNNLPVIKTLVDDDDDDENRELAKKPRLIIVGGGWGVSIVSCIFVSSLRAERKDVLQAVAIMKTLNPGDYHVTVVATDTYNTFTPLLPCMYLRCCPGFLHR